jgi:Sulfotransferase family
MYQGHVDFISRHMVQGWALNALDSDRCIDVLIFVDGTEISRITANIPRPDVAAAMGLQSALHGFSAHIPRQLETALAHEIQIRFADTGAIIPNGEERFSRLDDYDTAANLLAARDLELSALFVTHLPRSGSTLCMALLHRHPAVIVPEHYPFEVKPATYYARAARLLTEPGDHAFSGTPTEFMRSSMTLGFNPFNHFEFDRVFKDGNLQAHFFERSLKLSLFDALRKVSIDYYRHLIADQQKYTARYFAEKCEAQGIFYGTRASDMTLFPDARELLLIRDPRDILCSSLSYFRQPFSEDFVQNVKNGCETIRRIVSDKGTRTLVVKYEHLVFDQAAALKVIARHLSIDDRPWLDESFQAEKLFKQHGTAGSPQESVGRWKSELSESQKDACESEFATFLSEFGYELSRSHAPTLPVQP